MTEHLRAFGSEFQIQSLTQLSKDLSLVHGAARRPKLGDLKQLKSMHMNYSEMCEGASRRTLL